MPLANDLLLNPAFHSAIVAGIVARIRVAPDPPFNTAARARWNRRLLTQPDRLQSVATEMRVSVAADPTVIGPWLASSSIDQAAITLVVEGLLQFLAAEDLADYLAIEHSMTDETTIRILTAGWFVGAHIILGNIETMPEPLKKLLEEFGMSYQTGREFAQRFAPFVVTYPSLLQYGGDLTDVPVADIGAALAAIVTEWAALSANP